MVRPGWVRRVEGAAPPGGAGSGGQAALGRGWSEGRGRAVGACEPPLQQSGQPGRHLSQSPPAGPLIPVLLGPQSPCGWTPGRAGRAGGRAPVAGPRAGRAGRWPALSRPEPLAARWVLLQGSVLFCLLCGHHFRVPGRTRRPAGAVGGTGPSSRPPGVRRASALSTPLSRGAADEGREQAGPTSAFPPNEGLRVPPVPTERKLNCSPGCAERKTGTGSECCVGGALGGQHPGPCACAWPCRGRH